MMVFIAATCVSIRPSAFFSPFPGSRRCANATTERVNIVTVTPRIFFTALLLFKSLTAQDRHMAHQKGVKRCKRGKDQYLQIIACDRAFDHFICARARRRCSLDLIPSES